MSNVILNDEEASSLLVVYGIVKLTDGIGSDEVIL